ncbi:MAG: hypothetical protein R6W83_01085, partial [Cryobacterium sp.]
MPLAAVLVAAAGLFAAPALAQTPAVACRPIGGDAPPRIDGNLDDEAWQDAPWFDEFRQSVPVFDAPATEAT